MFTFTRHPRRLVAASAALLLLAACTDDAPVNPVQPPPVDAPHAVRQARDIETALATLRRVTARYQDLEVAKDEGFVLLHECETRPDEGPVGIVYVHMGRLLDGVSLMTFRATRCLNSASARSPRKTCPIPPSPIARTTRKGPMSSGSDSVNASSPSNRSGARRAAGESSTLPVR